VREALSDGLNVPMPETESSPSNGLTTFVCLLVCLGACVSVGGSIRQLVQNPDPGTQPGSQRLYISQVITRALGHTCAAIFVLNSKGSNWSLIILISYDDTSREKIEIPQRHTHARNSSASRHKVLTHAPAQN
jgi:hypothetical protein